MPDDPNQLTETLEETTTLDELIGDDESPDEEVVSDDKVVPVKPAEKKEDKEDKTDDDDLEVEDDNDEEFKLDDNEEINFYNIPRRKEILKQFPELFKKFPGLEHSLYGSKTYREIFPTVHDAREAKQAADRFNEVVATVRSGDIKSVLGDIKANNPEGFKKLTNTYLATLAEVDKDAYFENLSAIMSNTLAAAFESGKALGDTDEAKNLRAAAQIINKFVFQTTNIQPRALGQPAQQDDPQKAELDKQRATFARQQFDAAANDVSSRTVGTIRGAIEKKIDPENRMSDYVRSKAIDDAMVLLNREMGNDNYYINVIDKLWLASHKENYSNESKKRIVGAVFKKAQTVIPDILRKVRTDALKGMAARDRDASQSRDNRPVNRGRPASQDVSNKSNDRLKEEAKNFKGSTLDFLMKD